MSAVTLNPTVSSQPFFSPVTLSLFQGAQISQVAAELSLLLNLFSEWPYLYQPSSPEENLTYIAQRYVQQPKSTAFLAYDQGQLVGMALGLPLNCAPDHYQAAFPVEERRSDIFYFGELVVIPSHRHRKIAIQLADKMLPFVQQSGYKAICFASLNRTDRQHLKPANYHNPDPFFEKQGFKLREGSTIIGKWQVVGEDRETEHPMQVWWKISCLAQMALFFVNYKGKFYLK